MKRNSYRKYEIKKCRVCFSANVISILSLGEQYLSDFVATNRKPKKFPLTLVLCEDCHLLQLKHTVPQKFLYTQRYGYKSGINKTMRDELESIGKKSVKKLSKKSNNKVVVVDIGANDGTLLKSYPSSFYKIGIEPIEKLAEECKNHADAVVNDFFNIAAYKKKLGNKKADIVSAISCFYDMEEPNTFVADVKEILQEDGIFVIQQNYLVGMLEQNAFDNVVHEHLEYYSLLSLENLLARHGMEVFDVEFTDLNGGSFRTYIANTGKRRISKAVIQCREYEKKLTLNKKKIYDSFAQRVTKNGKNLHTIIKKLIKKKKKVYVYGASTRGNTLLQFCGLDTSMLAAAVERNPEKWGKKIASIALPIISEEQAREEKPDYMLVLPWFFRKEFLFREKKYLKSGGHLIFPLPKVEIV